LLRIQRLSGYFYFQRKEEVDMREKGDQKFERVFDRFTKSKQVHEAVLLVENTKGDFSFSKGYGGKEIDSLFLMASITKLFTTACILILSEQKRLSLDDKITQYFNNSILKGLHVYAGNEYTSELTIVDLLFQTSGLPDVYEEGKGSTKKRLIEEDFYFTLEEQIAGTKKLRPHFAPKRGAKAHYADINFDLLGEVLKTVCNSALSQIYKQYIFDPLGLSDTHLPESEHEFVPGIYFKDRLIYRPKFVISSGASGGCITTARDLMVFIKAFFGGRLFSRAIFDTLSSYHKLQASMGPVYYGGGYMQIPLNGMATLFLGKGELLGHSGSTGSFAFYYPLKDLFFVGDLNQMSNAALAVRLSMRLAMAV